MIEPHDVVSPDDTGSDTFARFKYQAHVTFAYCLELVRGEQVTAVFAEHIEDIAVQEASLWRFLQVKSRIAERGPWSLADAAHAFRSLWRAYQAVGTCLDATYELCLEGTLRKGDPLTVLVAGAGLDDESLMRLADECGTDIEGVRPFAARLRVHTLSPLTSILAENIRLLGQAAPHLGMGEIERTYTVAMTAIEDAMTADRLEGQWPAALFLAPDERSRLRVAAKRIDRERAKQIFAPILVVPRKTPFILPPIDLRAFTGRSAELQRLESILLRTDGEKVSSIAGVSGAGGIGKSALACQFAQLHRHAFPEGVIGLRVDGRELITIAREFARSAGAPIDPDDAREASTIMQEVFGDRRVLLLFDNAEDTAIRSLLPGGTRCAVIITTRDRGLPVLLGVPETARLDISPLPPDQARELLERLAGARVTADPDAASRICALVGYLPLAIRIAGATLEMERWRALQEYEHALREEKERLSLLSVRRDSELDVRASFSLSLRLLEPGEIDFFAGLAVCAQDGFLPMAAAAANGCGEQTAQQHLAQLFRLSLVNRSSTGSARFVLHPLIRLFAREQAEGRGVLTVAETRHREFYADLVKTKTRESGDPEAAALLGREIDDIVTAAESMRRHDVLDYEFVIQLEPFFQHYGYWEKAANIFAAFHHAAEQAEDWSSVAHLQLQQAKFLALRGRLEDADRILLALESVIERIEPNARRRATAMWLNTRGGVLQRQGDLTGAVDAFRRSDEILTALGDLRGRAMVLNSLGGVLQRQGKFDEAADAFRGSYEVEVDVGNRRGQAMVLNSLGGVLHRQGKFDAAVEAFRRSCALEVGLGNRRGEAMVLNSLGGALQRQGKFDEAVEAFRRSDELLVDLGDRRGEAMVLNSLGGVYQRQGKFDEAVEAFRRSCDLEVDLGNRRGEAMVLNSFGGALQRQGKFDEAVEAFRRSYQLLVELRDQRGQAMVLNSLGGVLQRQGKFDEAVEAFRKSYAISEELDDQRSLAMVLNSLGGVLQRQGKFDEAVKAFRKSYAISEELEDQRSLAMVLNSLGGALQRQGKFDEAVEAFRSSYEISEELDDQRSLAMVLNSLGGVLQRQRKFDDAVEAFRRSCDLEVSLSNRRGEAMVLNSLGGVLQRQAKFDEAVEAFRRSYQLLLELRDQRGQAMVLNSLGGALQRQGKPEEAFDAFRASIDIGEKLRDNRHLAMVHTAFGRALLQTDRKAAVRELREGFEVDVRLKNKKGVGMVAPDLIETLVKLGRVSEAVDVCKRALAIVPTHGRLLTLQRDLGRRDS